jgi:hypothetical protein
MMDILNRRLGIVAWLVADGPFVDITFSHVETRSRRKSARDHTGHGYPVRGTRSPQDVSSGPVQLKQSPCPGPQVVYLALRARPWKAAVGRFSL